MHGTVLDFIARWITSDIVCGKRVLEVGSFDVNGSPRTAIIPLRPLEYIGIDIMSGKGVDQVCDARELDRVFGQDSFDLVISAEMLEHVEDWKLVISQMKRVTKSKGVLCVTTRSPGFPYHPHPIDCWRFTRDDFTKIFRDYHIVALEDDLPGSPGIFGCFVKPNPFHEVFLDGLSVARAPVGSS